MLPTIENVFGEICVAELLPHDTSLILLLLPMRDCVQARIYYRIYAHKRIDGIIRREIGPMSIFLSA